MKLCSSCLEAKPELEFYVNGTKVSGDPRFSSRCKKCHNVKVVEWQKKNASKVKEYVRNSCKKAYDANPEKYREKSAKRRLANPDAHKTRVKASYLKKQKNIDEVELERRRRNSKRWAALNKEKIKKISSSWVKRNTAKNSSKQALRRTIKLQSSPKWLTAIQKAQIQEFYDICAAVSMQTSIKHHVDHICPLNGKNVKGLHVPWNMQVIPASENIRKSNRVDGA
jgi:hypothetical protein